MASTLQDLRDRLRHKLALPEADLMVPNSDLDISINDGLNAMSTDYDWPWLFTQADITTVAGTSAYALPTTPIFVRTLNVTNVGLGRDLLARQRRDLSRFYQTQVQTGEPLYYSTYGASIRLAPVPDQVYTIRHVFVQAEPPLVSGSDVPLCPDHFSDTIVLYAAVEESTRMKDFGQRNAFLADIQAWKARMRDNVRQTASTLKIRARSDYWI